MPLSKRITDKIDAAVKDALYGTAGGSPAFTAEQARYIESRFWGVVEDYEQCYAHFLCLLAQGRTIDQAIFGARAYFGY